MEQMSLQRLPRLLDQGLGEAMLALRQPWRSLEAWRGLVAEERRFGRSADQAVITVVVPLYRRWDFVLGQVAAFAQDSCFLKGEARLLYVVDDPSIEAEFLGWCEGQLQDDVVDVSVLCLRRNSGFALACNTGVLKAQTQHVCLLNSDVLPLSSGWLEPLQQVLMAQPQALVAPLLLTDTGLIQHAGMRRQDSVATGLPTCVHPGKGLSPQRLDNQAEPLAVEALSGAALCMERQRFLGMGGFDPAFGRGDFEDLELSVRWQQQQGPCLMVTSARLVHLERQSLKPEIEVLPQARSCCNAWLARHLIAAAAGAHRT